MNYLGGCPKIELTCYILSRKPKERKSINAVYIQSIRCFLSIVNEANIVTEPPPSAQQSNIQAFRLACFEFQLCLGEATELPVYKGASFHGAFGQALARIGTDAGRDIYPVRNVWGRGRGAVHRTKRQERGECPVPPIVCHTPSRFATVFCCPTFRESDDKTWVVIRKSVAMFNH